MPWKQQGGGGGGLKEAAVTAATGPRGASCLAAEAAVPAASPTRGPDPQGSGSGKNILPGGPGSARGVIIALLLIVIVWLLSGLYRVQPGENGIELLCRYVNTTRRV